MKKKTTWDTYTLASISALAAVVFVVSMLRIVLPDGGKLHFGNTICLLAGLILGPVPGGLAAGLGSGLYDISTAYGPVEAIITFVSKFMMAYVCGLLADASREEQPNIVRAYIGSLAGQVTYLALYMLKTYIFQRYVYGFPMDTVWATMLSKLLASLLNAGVAVAVAPIFYRAVWPAVRRIQAGTGHRAA